MLRHASDSASDALLCGYSAAHRGMLLCFPDTSPRGGADDPHPLLGEGASYYVDATTDTWADWQMYTYLTVDVPPAPLFRDALERNIIPQVGRLAPTPIPTPPPDLTPHDPFRRSSRERPTAVCCRCRSLRA